MEALPSVYEAYASSAPGVCQASARRVPGACQACARRVPVLLNQMCCCVLFVFVCVSVRNASVSDNSLQKSLTMGGLVQKSLTTAGRVQDCFTIAGRVDNGLRPGWLCREGPTYTYEL